MSYDEIYITGTDIKNHIFCPRIIYFKRVMDIEPKLYSQQLNAKFEHELEEDKERKRKYVLPNIKADNITYNLSIRSERLRSSAIIDCVIEYDNRLIPVEFKVAKSRNGKAYADHKYQLTFYALLLEDMYNKDVNEGYINYLIDSKIVRIIITDAMKLYVRRLITNIRNNIENEKLPPITVSKKKCFGGCGYRYVCYGY
ncbi:MAG: CRISPR-associated protein Cas4 [Candidatus Nitrosocaldaceae archaeon]|nr:MAG: CRISPR-associated protein Cas4 [Candidatus Nitrosocaldaceae archaeon]